MASVKYWDKESKSWKVASKGGSGGTVSDERIAQAVEDYMAEHPVEVPDSSQNATLTGQGAPTDTTKGSIGSLYMDTDTGNFYKCVVATDDAYTWIPMDKRFDTGIGNAHGLSVCLTDAAAGKPRSLKIFGRTVQNGTPSVENPIAPTQVEDGNFVRLYRYGKNLCDKTEITFTNGGTTEVSLPCGTAYGAHPGNTYTISADIVLSNCEKGVASVRVYDRNNTRIAIQNQEIPGDGKLKLTFTVPDVGLKGIYLGMYYSVAGETLTLRNIQMEHGEIATEYEPFDLVKVQCYNTGTFHGIPAENGGNYTDKNGQQYICDVVNYDNLSIEKHCGVIESYAGEDIPGVYMSSTGALTAGATVVYALSEPIVSSMSASTISEYNGFSLRSPNNNLNTLYGAWVSVEYDKTKEVEKEEEPVNVQAAFDPTHYGMTILWLEGDTAGMSKDVAVDLKYRYKNIEGTASVKWQGSTSVAFPKKNYTIKFDTAFELVEGWGEQKKYCFKANYIDHSHARNICCAKLWGQVVRRRSAVPAQFAKLPNCGAIDGIPCAIMLNGKFHGLYTWNIPKDGWMMGMGEGDREAILCAEGTTDAKGFKTTIAALDTEYSYEYSKDENDTEWIVESLNRLIQACLDSDGTDLDTTIAQYLDWDSAIDSYIFTNLISGHDNIMRNYILCTFDGVKWYFSQYDMDETFGQVGSGTAFRTSYARPTFASSANEHRVYELIKLYKMDKVKERYEQLRNGIMSELNVCGTFSNFIKDIPPHALMADLELYPTIPSAAMSNYAQIAHYYSLRVKEADKEIEAL